MTATKEQVLTALTIVKVTLEAIRDSGPLGISQGQLYAVMMGKLSLEQFESMMRVIKRTGLVRLDNTGLLTWIGPASNQ